MQAYLGIATLVAFVILVLIRVRALKKEGIDAIEFGNKDRKDFQLIPFVVFYFYHITAHAFHLPILGGQELFYFKAVNYLGSIMCLIALVFFVWTLLSFKKSFRVGLMDNREQGLVTTGAFSISRNPIYVCFILMLVGQFLIFPNVIMLLYVLAGSLRINKQVLKEEHFLTDQYGEAYLVYRKNVRRYL